MPPGLRRATPRVDYNAPGMTAAHPQARWWQQGAWLKRHWPYRAPATLLYMAVFFLGYFWLLRHPQFPLTRMPLTRMDRWIAFQPWSLVLYASLWAYISLVPALLRARRELLAYVWSVTWASLIGFGIFFFWPTAVPRPDIDWARYPSVAFLKSVDASGNACPSLHVAFSVLTCLWLDHWLKQVRAPAWPRIVNLAWFLVIVYSTLATKQHVALDVVTGAALGALVTVPYLYRLRAGSVLTCAAEYQ